MKRVATIRDPPLWNILSVICMWLGRKETDVEQRIEKDANGAIIPNEFSAV
ncbi:hypothetical protein WH47_08944 [Habropoda laboriosa]|uniref:Uncharacterized protein n=1 Tax=Habropoda laboriosa TaxID=597456 RepID=A0A0L7R718_9HYME|nr:hypothetical protein WH47_08944 [Habropoda laboriosa]